LYAKALAKADNYRPQK